MTEREAKIKALAWWRDALAQRLAVAKPGEVEGLKVAHRMSVQQLERLGTRSPSSTNTGG